MNKKKQDEIIQKLNAVITALNNIYVKGEQNLANLSGSIAVLKDVNEEISNYTAEDIKPTTVAANTKPKK